MLFGTKRRLDELEDSLERLQGRFKTLELAWQDTQDKLLRAMARVVKTRQRMEELDKATENGEGEPTTPPTPSRGGLLLTPKQKEIQQQILRRRAGG